MRLNFRFSSDTAAEIQPEMRVGSYIPAERRVRAQGLGRIAPFVPLGRHLPLFFLHIPRCSGASTTAFLRRLYGPDGVVTGAEQVACAVTAGHQAPPRADCVIGSIPLMRWEMLRDTAAYGRITVLRDPWARLVSQINHFAVLGESCFAAGSSAQLMAAEVAGADFTSRRGLERLRRRISLVEGGFDNLQTRMLLTGSMSSMVKPITPRDIDRAVFELERFAVIGFCEDQGATQRAMIRLLGSELRPAPEFEASGRAVALSLRNDLAREVLEPWIAADLELYRRAKQVSHTRQPI